MLSAFFTAALRSPDRRKTLWRALVSHVLFLAGSAWLLAGSQSGWGGVLLGQLLLTAGIVEGALLVGWRLTQLPKSQALEFLLVSPLQPSRVLLGEALVGLAFLGLVTLTGLPLLALLTGTGLLRPADVVVLLVMPFTWGAVTGLGLAVWAYESALFRRVGERFALGLVVLYLFLGVLAGDTLLPWLLELPDDLGRPLYTALLVLRDYNPFGVMRYWSLNPAELAWGRVAGFEVFALSLVPLLLWRAARRLKPHFHERHYKPALLRDRGDRGQIGDQPLTWWAVRRVWEYSGRINFWLAGGFGVLYALYTLAGPHWPARMSSTVFVICDRLAGTAGLATGLVVLAAVPAAFQYGLWDPNSSERCRRLELLLLTRLDARDYWHAAVTAAWGRGRGYFGVAVLLWVTAAIAGQASVAQVISAAASGVLLWGLYFALGFRAFSRGRQANGLGVLLTLGLPLAAIALFRLGLPFPATLIPAGGVYGAAQWSSAVWFVGPVLVGLLTLLVAWEARRSCDAQLRHWYDLNHGSKLMS